MSDLRKISQSLYRPDGSIRTFGEQLYLYEKGELLNSDIFIVSKETNLPFVQFTNSNLPLSMTQSILKKIENTHNLTIKELEDLPYLLESSPLALESHGHRILVVLDKIDDKDNDLMTVLKLNKQHNDITVNEVRSVYADDIQAEINNTQSHQQEIYKNDRTDSWLSRRGIILEPNQRQPISNDNTKEWLHRVGKRAAYERQTQTEQTDPLTAAIARQAPAHKACNNISRVEVGKSEEVR